MQFLKLLQLPEFEDEEQARQASLLSAILYVMLCVAGIFALIPFFITSIHPAQDYTITGGTIIVVVILRILLQQKYIKLTSIAWIGALLTITTYSLWVNDGFYSGVGYAYFLAIIITGVLLNRRGTLIVGGLCIAANTIFFLFIWQGHITLTEPFRRSLIHWIFLNITLSAGTALSATGAQNITRALTKAHNNAAALRESKQALQKSVTRYRTLIESTPLGVYECDINGCIVLANSTTKRVTGYGDAIIGKYVWEVMASSAEKDALPAYFEHLHAKQPEPEPYFSLNLTPQGQTVHFRVDWNYKRDESGQHIGYVCVCTDITQIRKAEAAQQHYAQRIKLLHDIDHAILRATSASEIVHATLERLHRLIPCLVASVITFDFENNEAQTIALYARGQHIPELELTVALNTFNIAELKAGIIQHIPDMTQQETHSESTQYLFDNGMRSYIHVPLITHQELVGSLNLGSELTHYFTPDHIKIAQEIAASLAVTLWQARLHMQVQEDAQTKAALLQEVNHRVGNNLMSLVGLLHTEQRFAQKAAGEECEENNQLLERLIQRVNGMAEVHKMLSSLSWAPLPLTDLIKRLVKLPLDTLPLEQNISLAITPSPIVVSPRQANNLAFIINELVTNTVKYALIDRDSAHIHIQITQETGDIIFEYRDDGPGYPPSVLEHNEFNMGLYLIHRFVNNALQGKVILYNDNGAVTEMRFGLMVNHAVK